MIHDINYEMIFHMYKENKKNPNASHDEMKENYQNSLYRINNKQWSKIIKICGIKR